MNTTTITTPRDTEKALTKIPSVSFAIKKEGSDSKVLQKGPLESVFPCSESKILDFLIAFQDYDYSISDISKNSGVGFKTTLGIIRELESKNIILKERTVGRAQMYRLNTNSDHAKSISKLALDIATERALQILP